MEAGTPLMKRIRVTLGGEVVAEVDADRELILGRGEGADIRIQDGEISSRHLRIGPEGGGVVVTDLGSKFNELFTAPVADGGYERAAETRNVAIDLELNAPAGFSATGAELLEEAGTAVETKAVHDKLQLKHGSVLIAAITSCVAIPIGWL